MNRICSLTAAFTLLWLCGVTNASGVILSEYNAVSNNNWLGNPNDPLCEGPAGFTCANNEDTFFGRVMGNGGNWLELVIIADHVDMRGWQLFWEELGNGKAGTIFLSSNPFWADLRTGTILTFTELTTDSGGLDTDTTFDPCNGDWWININTFDATFVTTVTNVPGDGPGNFSIGNELWQITIKDDVGTVIFGPAGEGAPSYTGTNVNSREVCQLQADPSSSITPSGPYEDHDSSSFGSPNNWEDPITFCDFLQNFTATRQPIAASCVICRKIILNEYNAVGNEAYLNGGTLRADSDGGQAGDTFFGRVLANAGDWFELIVIEDHLDLRGWKLSWHQSGGDGSGTIFLSNHAFWSDLRSGTIVTFIERNTAQGGLDTDTSYNPGAGDIWVNINTFDAAYVSSTTGTVAGHLSGSFDVSDSEWHLTIKDSGDATVFGPAGEGSVYYYRDKVSNENICRLEEDPSSSITWLSAYDDGSSSSTFGSPNQWTICPDPASIAQDLGYIPDPSCGGNPADINNDGMVNVDDLLAVINSWGICPTGNCSADIAPLGGDGQVNVDDLLAVINNWG